MIDMVNLIHLDIYMDYNLYTVLKKYRILDNFDRYICQNICMENLIRLDIYTEDLIHLDICMENLIHLNIYMDYSLYIVLKKYRILDNFDRYIY